MLKKFIDSLIPHAVGLLLMAMGWYISIVNVGLARFQTNTLFNEWTGFGFIIILCGAYLPEIWIGIRKFVTKE